MPQCDRCEKEIREELIFSCSYCTGSYCSSHRLPENHNCPGVSTASTHGPDFRNVEAEIADENSDLRNTQQETQPSSVEKTSERDTQSDTGKPHRDWEPDTSSPEVVIDRGGSDDKNSDETERKLLWDVRLKGWRRGLRRTFWRLLPSPSQLLILLFAVFLVLFIIGFTGGIGVEPIDDTGEQVVAIVFSMGESVSFATEGSDDGNEAESEPYDYRDIDRSQVELLIHEEVNQEREPTTDLNFDEDLREIARYHSERMVEEDFFSHTGPNGETLGDRLSRFGYDCSAAGENIAQSWVYEDVIGHGYIDSEEDLAEAVVADWMDSSGHRENINRDTWQRQAIGVAISDDGAVYVTQNFC
jgi:uncharacterized protein YkwD